MSSSLLHVVLTLAALLGSHHVRAQQVQLAVMPTAPSVGPKTSSWDSCGSLHRHGGALGGSAPEGEMLCDASESSFFGTDDRDAWALLDKRQQQPQQQASSSTISIPQTAAVGGITVTQPPATAQATYYKIASGNFITFGWSFTDVIASPTSLTMQAFCSQNGNTYPVGPTQGIAGGSTQYAWNPFDYEANPNAVPLAEASYTLRVFDQRGFFAAATGGYMRPYSGTIFALYRPQAYTALADGWKCSACSAALRATPIHPAVIATALAFFFGTWTIFSRCS